MLNIEQFTDFIVRPTLGYLNLESLAATRLVVGTALIESNLTYVQQLKGGPARGVYQMEPATEHDIWTNFLEFKPTLKTMVTKLLAATPSRTQQLVTNLSYATAMARIHYFRVSAPLPSAGDVDGLAMYHKKYYNTAKGKTDPAESRIVFASLKEHIT